MYSVLGALTLGLIVPFSRAQYPPTPTNLTIINSTVNSEVTISFKKIEVCEVSPGVKSYSGYVHLPGSLLPDLGGYDINSYFMYFGARENASTAPLAIYLAGGPGESSAYAALSSESGPCYVNIEGTDTINNSWSFNNYANVLYIDQPVQTGFSYNSLINATFNLEDGSIVPLNGTASSTVNATYGYGTFPSQDYESTANTTVSAAKALWHFAEHWLSSFPGYETESSKISVWGNSYGGYWVPETGAQFSKNLQNLSSEHPLQSKNLTIDAIGITNGCIDAASGFTGYVEYAYNNTYDIKFGSEAIYQEAMTNLTMPGGCLDLIQECRALGAMADPGFTGTNETVNELCMGALGYCEQYVISSFPDLNMRDPFDIAFPVPIPCEYYLPVSQYLNNATIQAALGVPLNVTINSNTVLTNFGLNPYTDRPISDMTGDPARQNGLTSIEYLLANNVKVALIFGDRDYRCPWTGGELTALAANWTHQSNFASAGYEEMQGIETPIDQGGLQAVVKQYGQFSFSRVFEAGHQVSAYAPETVYRIFERTLKGVDVATGEENVEVGYTSSGPVSSLVWRNTLPQNLTQSCMVEGQFTPANPWVAVGGGS